MNSKNPENGLRFQPKKFDAKTSEPNPRELFRLAARGEKTSRPPFWIMRQAGRYFEGYRALKDKYGFLGIVKAPEIGVRAAVEPVERFGFDCAILFSDILAVSEALGFPYKFRDGGGIVLERKIANESDIDNMPSPENALENLGYVFENLRILRSTLPDRAIFGFCGSPFTLAAYMVEGQSSPDFPNYRKFIGGDEKLFRKLSAKLADTLALYAREQARLGIDAFQIFDSHAALAPVGLWRGLSGDAIETVSREISGKCFVSLFANGMGKRLAELSRASADIVSLDSSVSLPEAKKILPKSKALQGNLDPRLLSCATPEEVYARSAEIIARMSPLGGHIFNLGHGILPDAKTKNVEAMCRAAKESGQ